jgi:hypothetical protein
VAKKAVPVEDCFFCEQQPCKCVVMAREKRMRQTLRDHDNAQKEVPENEQPE